VRKSFASARPRTASSHGTRVVSDSLPSCFSDFFVSVTDVNAASAGRVGFGAYSEAFSAIRGPCRDRRHMLTPPSQKLECGFLSKSSPPGPQEVSKLFRRFAASAKSEGLTISYPALPNNSRSLRRVSSSSSVEQDRGHNGQLRPTRWPSLSSCISPPTAYAENTCDRPPSITPRRLR